MYCRNEKQQLLRGSKWRRLKMVSLASNPTRICSDCGMSTGYLEMDHIKPVKELWKGIDSKREREQSFFDNSNLQLLCKDCHRRKTKKENGIKERPAQWAGFNQLIEEVCNG